MTARGSRWTWLLVLGTLTGCGQPSTSPTPDTGARQTALAFYDGLVRQEDILSDRGEGTWPNGVTSARTLAVPQTDARGCM